MNFRIANTKGVILCVVSILLLSLSIVGALYHNVFLLVSVILLVSC